MASFDPPLHQGIDVEQGSANSDSDIPQLVLDGMELHRHGDINGALRVFRLAFANGLNLPETAVVPVLVDVTSCLAAAFLADSQSPVAYDFLSGLSRDVAEVMAGLLQLANFPDGTVDIFRIEEKILLSYTALLTAAKRFGEAIELLNTALIQTYSLARTRAMYFARRQEAGKTDRLDGSFCAAPFERFEILPGGNVALCCSAFMPRTVGNIYSQDWEDIWNSPSAQAIRASIHDGSFRFCDRLKCPAFEQGFEPVPDDAEATRIAAREKLTRLKSPPRWLNLSFDRSCNLKCPSCRKQHHVASRKESDRMLEMAERQIMPLLKEARYAIVTGAGDPFASRTYRHILRTIDKRRFPNLKLHIATNGILFTPAEWSNLSQLQGVIENVVVSIDAATPETYARMRGGNWDKLLANLQFLGGLQQEGAFRGFREGLFRGFGIAFVVQAENWREIPAFVRLGRSIGVSQVYFSLLENWGAFSAREFSEKAVQFTAHPDHLRFLEILTSEELEDPMVTLGVLQPFREKALADFRLPESTTSSPQEPDSKFMHAEPKSITREIETAYAVSHGIHR